MDIFIHVLWKLKRVGNSDGDKNCLKTVKNNYVWTNWTQKSVYNWRWKCFGGILPRANANFIRSAF